MSYYERHIFFCLNQRDNGENACAQHGASKAAGAGKPKDVRGQERGQSL